MPKISKKKNIVEKKVSGQGKMSKGKSGVAADSKTGKAPASSQIHFPRERNFMAYLYKIVKKVHPEVGANKESMETMNSIILTFYDELAKESARISKKGNHNTLQATDIQTAAKLVLPQELALHAITSGASSVQKYLNSKKADTKN